MTHKLQLRNLALSLVLALTMVIGALPFMTQMGHATDAVTYLDANGQEQSVTEYTAVTADTTAWSAGWYVVNGEVPIGDISVSGDVNLILCDGAKLIVDAESDAIYINNGSLSVYAQSTGDAMGELNATGRGYGDGIDTFYGSITINGGNVTATGDYGIFTMYDGVTVNGGNLTCTGNSGGIRILKENNLTVRGGALNATTTSDGSNAINTAGSIEISGGTVNATGGYNSAISTHGFTLSGGSVTATATNNNAVGINNNGSSNGVDISGGNLIAIGPSSAIGNATVKNSIAGTGWMDTEGTQGMADIAVSETGQSLTYKKVQFPAEEPVNVELNAGTGHGALFTDEVLADMVSQTEGFASATREGDIITIGVTDATMTDYQLLRTLDEYVMTKLFAPPAGPRHNDEVFMTTAPKSVDKYAKNSELSADIKARKENPTVIEEGFTAYMLWATKYSEEITLTAKTPVAGGDPKDYLPETPKGIVLYEVTLPPDVPEGTPEPPKFNFWTTNTTEPFTADPMEGTFAAGDEYACVATPGIDPESSNWAKYLDPDISIKVGKVEGEVVGKRNGRPSVSYKVAVAKVDVTGVTLNKDKLTLEKEAYETLEATVAPEDASKKTVTWKSSNDGVATVDNNGKVTAVAVGKANITATATNGTEATTDDKTATCNVTVTGKSFNITKSEMENGSVTVKVGDAEATKAKEGETVTLVVEPAEGYQLKEIKAVYLGMTTLDLTEVKEGEKYTFTMPSNDVTVSAKFEKKPVTVKIDVGAGHAALFTSDVLNEIKTNFYLQDATISGNIITLKGVNPSNTEYGMWSDINGFVGNLVQPADYMHNKERFRVPAYKPFDEYATSSDLDNDIYDDVHESTPVSEGLTYYLLWMKPYTKLELDNGNPTCGKEWWKAFPTVPDGFIVDQEVSYWIDENEKVVEKFEGGKTYTFKGKIYHRPYGYLWKYFIDPNNFTLTVKDGKDLEYSLNGDTITLSFKATADHDWDAGTVTKEPTETTEGVKTYKCKHCDATKTEVIPKKGSSVVANAPKVTTTAKTSARSMKVKWTMKWGQVSGAKKYTVAYRKVGSNKWTYKTTKKTKYVVKKHKMKGLYEYKVAAVSSNGTVWSDTNYRYFSKVKTKAKAGKGAVKVSWKKDKTATGYQVKIANNKKMKNSETITLGAGSKSYKFTGLTKGKKYYVRVRPIKEHGGVTYTGILSKTFKVKVK